MEWLEVGPERRGAGLEATKRSMVGGGETQSVAHRPLARSCRSLEWTARAGGVPPTPAVDAPDWITAGGAAVILAEAAARKRYKKAEREGSGPRLDVGAAEGWAVARPEAEGSAHASCA
jgi:hypothetical protein